MITVRKHKGHSGMSVFEWRVYRETTGRIAVRTQLGKFRTQEEAECVAEHYRKNAERVAEVKAAFDQRVADQRAAKV